MVIPFEVTFYRNDYTGEDFMKFTNSLDEAIEEMDKYSFNANELQDLRILFNSNLEDDITFWVDSMDMLPDVCFDNENEDDGIVNMFKPSNAIRGLYLNTQSKNNTEKIEYPNLLPGSYKMVVNLKGLKYYSFLKIKPSRISEEQLSLMREEVETTLTGLSKQLINRNLDKKNYIDNIDRENVFHHYNVLLNSYEELILNLNKIYLDPRYKISKVYSLKNLGSPIKLDIESIKFKQIRRDVTNKVKGFNYEIDYSIPINTSLKKIILSIKKENSNVILYLLESLKRLEIDEQERIKYSREKGDLEKRMAIYTSHLSKFRKLQQNLLKILNSEWMKPLKSILQNHSQLARTTHYNNIYKVYQELINRKPLVNDPFQYYSYYWKETPKLYEIWGFVKIINLLVESKYNFKDIKGWIFDDEFNRGILPFLDAETTIDFKNEDGLNLRIYYDSEITRNYDETTKENPVYTIQNHNKPDFRMDIYNKDIYKGSLIADFKYRSLDKLGTVGVYTRNNKKNAGYAVYKQLLEYSYARSFYLNQSFKSKNSNFSVIRVIGIFPRQENERVANKKDHEANIVRMSLSPNCTIEHLVQEIDDIIDSVINKGL